MAVHNSILDAIGHTPLVQVEDTPAKILVKVEGMNPGGSIKDRIAMNMIESAEKAGKLKPGATIIEPTSGNTGIGLAMAGSAKGYKVIMTMPETMSIERRKLLKAYGAEVVLTPGAQGMKGAIAKADELHKEIPDSFIPSQFSNPANPEIWEDTDGNVDVFVAGVGTGGTLSGTGKYLKDKNPEVKIFAVEPVTSPVLSEGKAGPHKIQGIGAGFVPETLDTSIYDGVLTISDQEAFEGGRELARKKGILAGISSGANYVAAKKLAERPEFAGKTIVTVLPDTGDRYLSTALFEEQA